MALRPEDYAAAAQYLGGTGAAFAPAPTPPEEALPSPMLGFNVQDNALLSPSTKDFLAPPIPAAIARPAPVADGGMQDALAASNVRPQSGGGPDLRQFSNPNVPVSLARPEEKVGANEHSGAPRKLQVVDGEIGSTDVGTTANVGAGVGGEPSGSKMLGGTYRPGGWSDAQSPVRRASFLEAKNAQHQMGGAEGEYAHAQQLDAREREAMMAEAAEQAAQRARDVAGREQLRQLAIDVQNKKLDDAVETAKETKVTGAGMLERNPGMLLMAIGSVLGGVLSARTGQPNQAQGALDAAINRDLEIQKVNADRSDKAVGQQANLVAQMRERFGDDRQADLAAEIAQRKIVDMHLERLGAKAQDRDTEAKIGVLKAGNQEKLADLDAKWDQMTHYNASMSGASPAGGKGDEKGLLIQLEDGRTVRAPTEPEATKLRAKQAAVISLERTAKQIDKLRETFGAYAPGWPTKEKADLERLSRQMLLGIKSAENLGALDKGAQEIGEDILGNPTSLTSRAGQRALGFASDARKNYESEIRSLGGEQVQRGYTRTPKGDLAPAQEYTGTAVNPRPAKSTPREGVK